MYFHEAISKRILELCKRNNISPNMLAEHSSIAPSTLNDVVNNKIAKPNSYLIYRICKTFNIELQEFFDSELFKTDFED